MLAILPSTIHIGTLVHWCSLPIVQWHYIFIFIITAIPTWCAAHAKSVAPAAHQIYARDKRFDAGPHRNTYILWSHSLSELSACVECRLGAVFWKNIVAQRVTWRWHRSRASVRSSTWIAIWCLLVLYGAKARSLYWGVSCIVSGAFGVAFAITQRLYRKVCYGVRRGVCVVVGLRKLNPCV